MELAERVDISKPCSWRVCLGREQCGRKRCVSQRVDCSLDTIVKKSESRTWSSFGSCHRALGFPGLCVEMNRIQDEVSSC